MQLVATQVHCPQCNAVLNVASGGLTATCPYCGSSSRIQREVAAPPPVASKIARQLPRRRTWLQLLLGLALAAPIGALLAVKTSPGALLPFGFVIVLFSFMFAVSREAVSWLGNSAPLVAEAEGTDLVIGLVRYLFVGDSIRIAAYDTRGRRRWETASLGTYLQVYQSKLVVVGDAIIRVGARGDVECREVATGVLRWLTNLDEVVCNVGLGARADELALETADAKWTVVAAADGSPRPDSVPRRVVQPPDPAEVSIDGMSVDRVVARDGGPAIALGYRSPGTPVPMLAAIDASRAVIWKCDVPATDPLTATGGGEHCALDDRDVAVVYARAAASVLTMFDRATGERRFETAIPTPFVNGLSLRKDAVAVSADGLRLFDRATGAPRARIGSM
jgi:hypothetical protein